MTLLESSLTEFFAPAEQAAIPLPVPTRQLMAANYSVYKTPSMAATIAGLPSESRFSASEGKPWGQGGPARGGEFLLLPFCYGCVALLILSIPLEEKPGPGIGLQRLGRSKAACA